MDKFDIKILTSPISISELKDLASHGFGDLIKAVVDIKSGVMAVGAELHADMEVVLIEQYKALRHNTWGLNLYPDKALEEFIEFDSMINLKPASGNRTRSIEDPEIQQKIKEIVKKFILA